MGSSFIDNFKNFKKANRPRFIILVILALLLSSCSTESEEEQSALASLEKETEEISSREKRKIQRTLLIYERHKDPIRRKIALKKLLKRGKEILPLLKKIWPKTTPHKRRAILQVLEKMDHQALSLLWELWIKEKKGSWTRREILRLVSHHRTFMSQKSEVLRQWLKEGKITSEEMSYILYRLDSEGLKLAENWLKDASPSTSQTLLAALARLGPKARPLTGKIKTYLDHSHPQLRSQALLCLSRQDLEKSQILTHCQSALKDKDSGVRRQALTLLRRVKGEDLPASLIPHLRKILANSDSQLRASAAHLSPSFGKKARPLIPQLIENLDRAQGREYLITLQSLEKLLPYSPQGIHSFKPLISKLETKKLPPLLRVLQELGPLARPLAPELKKRLDQSPTSLRSQIRKTLQAMVQEN